MLEKMLFRDIPILRRQNPGSQKARAESHIYALSRSRQQHFGFVLKLYYERAVCQRSQEISRIAED
jgi:hypothetical protein